MTCSNTDQVTTTSKASSSAGTWSGRRGREDELLGQLSATPATAAARLSASVSVGRMSYPTSFCGFPLSTRPRSMIPSPHPMSATTRSASSPGLLEKRQHLAGGLSKCSRNQTWGSSIAAHHRGPRSSVSSVPSPLSARRGCAERVSRLGTARSRSCAEPGRVATASTGRRSSSGSTA